MSSKLVKAHGGSKNLVSVEGGGAMMLGGILSKTTTNTQADVHMKGLSRLIAQTTGIPRKEPVMEGVIESTIPSHMKSVPEYHSVPKSEQGKTQAKRMGQVPFAGPKY
jgi:hypothetical protein